MERGKLEPVFGIQVIGYTGLLTKAVAASPASYSVCGSVWLHSPFELYSRGWAIHLTLLWFCSGEPHSFLLPPRPTRHLVAKLRF